MTFAVSHGSTNGYWLLHQANVTALASNNVSTAWGTTRTQRRSSMAGWKSIHMPRNTKRPPLSTTKLM